MRARCAHGQGRRPARDAQPSVREPSMLASRRRSAGYAGQPNAPALARSLDRNSVHDRCRDRAGVYGPAARNKFLNGRFMWRDHIRFFGQYAAALATHNKTGQARAVSNLKGYIEAVQRLSRNGHRAAAVRAPRVDHRARDAAEGPARCVFEASVREVVHARARGLRAHGHDGRHARRRDPEEVPGRSSRSERSRARGFRAARPASPARDSRHGLLSSSDHISSS